MGKDLMKTWASEIDMDDSLRVTLLEYLDESKQLIRQRYYLSLLDLLSPTLRGAVVTHTHGRLLRNVTILACENTRERRKFAMAISERLSTIVFGKGEIICSRGGV